MRALRRIATPVSVAVALGGCSFPLEEFHAPGAKDDAALSTNGDAAYGTLDSGVDTHVVRDSAATDAANDTLVTTDAGCVCVRQTGSKCKEWSPPGCGSKD